MTAKKKAWFYRGYFGFVKDRTTSFRDYILELERKFSHDLKELEKNYKTDIRKRGTDAEIDDYLIDYYADEAYRIDKIFTRSFRYSAVVGIYSLLETSMNSLCNILKQMNNLNVELSDMKGDGIERARLYLLKICKIDLLISSHEWAEIQKLNKIRNCIVHADGNILDVHSPENIKNIIKHTPGLSLENEHYVVIEKKYLESAISWVEDYLQELHEKSFPNNIRKKKRVKHQSSRQ